MSSTSASSVFQAGEGRVLTSVRVDPVHRELAGSLVDSELKRRKDESALNVRKKA